MLGFSCYKCSAMLDKTVFYWQNFFFSTWSPQKKMFEEGQGILRAIWLSHSDIMLPVKNLGSSHCSELVNFLVEAKFWLHWYDSSDLPELLYNIRLSKSNTYENHGIYMLMHTCLPIFYSFHICFKQPATQLRLFSFSSPGVRHSSPRRTTQYTRKKERMCESCLLIKCRVIQGVIFRYEKFCRRLLYLKVLMRKISFLRAKKFR